MSWVLSVIFMRLPILIKPLVVEDITICAILVIIVEDCVKVRKGIALGIEYYVFSRVFYPPKAIDVVYITSPTSSGITSM